MLSNYELLQYKIDRLTRESKKLKRVHQWGNWSNWRKFVNIDIEVNELKIKLLELENELLKDSLDGYENEVNI